MKELMLNDKHMIVVGPTGSGKTMRVILPYILAAIEEGESIVVTDGKDKLLSKVYERLVETGYNVLTINLRDVEKSHAWNPLELPYQYYMDGKIDVCLDLLNDLGSNIMVDKSQGESGDPFWTLSAKNLFVGLALALFEESEVCEEMVNLRSIYYMSTKGFEKVGNSTYIHTYFRDKPAESMAAINMSSTLSAPSDTRNSILSVFNQKILTFISKNSFWNKLCDDEIDFEQISENKTAVFLVFEDEKIEASAFINVFIRQLFEWYVKKNSEKNAQVLKKCHFVFDDFTSLVPFYNLQNMLMAARERNLFFLFSINSVSLLEKYYGEYITEFLMNNCRHWIVFSNTELKFNRNLMEMVRMFYGGNIECMDGLKNGMALVFDDVKEFKIKEFPIPEYKIKDYLRKDLLLVKKYEIFKIDEIVRKKLKTEMNKRIGFDLEESDFKIDQLIAKIDKKIAELEKEDKELKAKERKETDTGITTMPENEGKFRVYDENGKEVIMDVLFTFESQETGKQYIAYTDGTVENESTNVYAGIIDIDENGKQCLLPIESDEESKVMNTILKEIQNSLHDSLEENI